MARKGGFGGWGGSSKWPFGKPAKQPKPEKPKNTFGASANRDAAIKALREERCLTLTYDGLPRMVEVHTVGLTRADRPAMSCYQVGGQSSEPPATGWRLMCFDECFGVRVSDQPSKAPRDGYRRGAKSFSRIEAEL